jgi:hypothetical protein
MPTSLSRTVVLLRLLIIVPAAAIAQRSNPAVLDPGDDPVGRSRSNSRMPHVFLSYSRTDRGLVDRVREDLSARGVNVWSDRRLGLGGSWLAAISAAIDGARAVVVLATPAALASQWVMREVEAARALGKRIVPVLAGETRFGDLPAALAGLNGVDLADGYDESMATLAEAFGGPDVPAQTPPQTPPVLLLLTADDALAALVADVARPVGLAVVRLVPSDPDVLTVAASAHVAMIAGYGPADCDFIAGYVAGRGGRVLWVSETTEGHVPRAAAVRFCRNDPAELEREIGTVAFLPSQRAAHQGCEVECREGRQFTAPDRFCSSCPA